MRLLPGLLLSLLIPLTLPAQSLSAQGERLCLPSVPGIVDCIEGRFREYWEQNGGLPVFGYPTTPARPEANRDTGQTYLTQWFERNRFELHPENARPYDVLLGRLGDDRLRQLGLDWRENFPSGPPEEGCLYFDSTRQNLCDTLYSAGQCIGGCPIGFKRYWESHGLEFDGRPGKRYAESLALFGQPLTAAFIEPDETGSRQVVQWFERARFEWHPNNPDEFKVLLGLLGNEVR
jgi:hypothetical protein